MIKGYYRVISSGSIVAEYENMLTTNGLVTINQYLAHTTPDWAGSLAIGALRTNATSTSTTTLDYEILRYPVNLRAYKTTPSNQIVLKATIDPTAVFNAYEFGVFPAMINQATFKDHFKITDFSEQTSGSSNWYNVTTASSAAIWSSGPTPRSGGYGISIGNQTASLSLYNNISTYTESDSMSLLIYFPTAQSFTGWTIVVSLGDNSSTSNVWTASTTVNQSISASTASAIPLTFQTKPTNFTGTITSCSITFSGLNVGSNVYLDHLKILAGDVKTTDDYIVSRTTSSDNVTPLVSKAYGQPMELEYYIQVT